jgi:hypothetical protein
MKFENKHTDAKSNERFEFEYSFVTKTPKLGQCRWCNSYTRWIDVLFQVNVCSEECDSTMWQHYINDQKKDGTYENFENHFAKVKEELKLGQKCKEIWKDIIIVVRNQLDYFRECIESIQANSTNYHLYIWDNASDQNTVNYIEKLVLSYNLTKPSNWNITHIRSDANIGFIQPNNELASLGDSPYLVLLNSDTKVFENWDNTMVAFLEENPEVAQVGYWGGFLDSTGRGFGGSNGFEIDYVPGWCCCISRETYEKFGLFDEKLKFAYCEDSDFSLRLKESGKKIYSLYAPLVHHYQNKTVKEVEKEGTLDLRATFDHNHSYFKERWKDYLKEGRVMLRRESGCFKTPDSLLNEKQPA